MNATATENHQSVDEVMNEIHAELCAFFDASNPRQFHGFVRDAIFRMIRTSTFEPPRLDGSKPPEVMHNINLIIREKPGLTQSEIMVVYVKFFQHVFKYTLEAAERGREQATK